MPNRREFLAQTAVAGMSSGLFVMAGAQRAAAAEKNTTLASEPKGTVLASKPLRILILGGNGWIGPHFLRAALHRGHRVSVLSRPKKEKESAVLPVGVEPLLGDRNGDLSSIRNRDWDAVFDLATYVPNCSKRAVISGRSKVGWAFKYDNTGAQGSAQSAKGIEDPILIWTPSRSITFWPIPVESCPAPRWRRRPWSIQRYGAKSSVFLSDSRSKTANWLGTPQPRTSLYFRDRTWLDMKMRITGAS